MPAGRGAGGHRWSEPAGTRVRGDRATTDPVLVISFLPPPMSFADWLADPSTLLSPVAAPTAIDR